MKKLMIGLLAMTALSTPACAEQGGNEQAAQPANAAAPQNATAGANLPDADPAMWVVRDEDTTIYMFGTIHALDGRPWFNDEVKQAFDQAGELVVEVRLPTDQAAQQQMLAPLLGRFAIDPEGRKLSSVLTAEENTKLYQLLAPLGVPANGLEVMEPWFVSLTLVQAVASRLNMNPEAGAEMVLIKAATERGIPINELETAESQFQMFDSVPRADQIDALKEQIADPEQGIRTLQPMLQAWSVGDADRLASILTQDMEDNPEAYDMVFTRRNANWARWIDERLDRPGIVFLAVGAGHLAGRGSVQDQLQRLNIRSERVPAQ